MEAMGKKTIKGYSEGGGLSSERLPPSRSLPERRWGGTLGGEAASLREAPLPPDPSLPKSDWRLAGAFLHRRVRLRVGVSPISLAESTAADRAAADMRRWGKLDSMKADGTRHRLSCYQRMGWSAGEKGENYGYECQLKEGILGQPSADSSLCGGSLLTRLLAKPPLKGEVPAVGGRRGSVPPRCTSAAALSAAVDSTKPIRDHPPLRRNHLRRSNQLKRQPLFGRGGLGERRFSQRSGLSPRISPPSHLLQSSNFCAILKKSKIVRL